MISFKFPNTKLKAIQISCLPIFPLGYAFHYCDVKYTCWARHTVDTKLCLANFLITKITVWHRRTVAQTIASISIAHVSAPQFIA